MTRLAYVLALACALGCSDLPQPRAANSDACDAAGAHLAALGCRQAQTPRGTPFAAVCHRAAEDGRDLRADCLLRVTSCDDVRRVAATPRGQPCP